jgi:hypothetical protein
MEVAAYPPSPSPIPDVFETMRVPGVIELDNTFALLRRAAGI